MCCFELLCLPCFDGALSLSCCFSACARSVLLWYVPLLCCVVMWCCAGGALLCFVFRVCVVWFVACTYALGCCVWFVSRRCVPFRSVACCMLCVLSSGCVCGCVCVLYLSCVVLSCMWPCSVLFR